MSSSSAFIGIDTGGTYTDFVLFREGVVHILKVPSTPEAPYRASIAGIEILMPPDGFEVIHGSTVGTNAILERKGARTALITTKGFRDILHIGRQTREELYSLKPGDGEVLIKENRIIEADERVNWKGEILRDLDDEEISAIFESLRSKRIDSVAVCLLFSFLNDANEKKIASHREARQYEISLSSDVLCEFREFERCSTTVLNAYICPIMKRYLQKLADRMGLQGAKNLWIMQSNGGIFSLQSAVKKPVHTILSGPAAGVAGAFAVARTAGFQNVITIDMGGTSTDVSLGEGGALPVTMEGEIEKFPVGIPILDIHTIGAGGGSIAYVDEGGILKVGPRSAGADPGPACFGKGRHITVTDAHLILGRLPDKTFMEGKRKPDISRAAQFLTPMARKMGCSTEEAAWGILQVVQAQMEGALRVVSLQRGHDPRRFTLLAFGGAGPLHACELAASLNIPKVLIPRYPGVLSALGMILAPHFMEFSRTMKMALHTTESELLGEVFDSLSRKAAREMGSDRPLRYEYYLDMRYSGQSYELTVPVSDFSREEIARRFVALHRRRYGYARDHDEIEVVTFRVKAERKKSSPTMAAKPSEVKRAFEPAGSQKVLWAEGASPLREHLFPLIERESLPEGTTWEGPAIILQYDTTTFVPARWSCAVDEFGNLLLENPASLEERD